MKPLFASVAISLLSCVAANAASITLTNFSSGVLTPFLDSASGLPLTSGIAVMGTFTAEPTNVADVLGSFTQTLNSTNAAARRTAVGNPGFFNGTIVTDALATNDGFVGNSVYVVVGNGTTLANSTGLAVWKAVSNAAGNTYTADQPVGGPDTVTVIDSVGTLLIGTRVASFDAGAGAAPAYRLAQVIPEPSTLLLSAFGVLGLLRRKR